MRNGKYHNKKTYVAYYGLFCLCPPENEILGHSLAWNRHLGPYLHYFDYSLSNRNSVNHKSIFKKSEQCIKECDFAAFLLFLMSLTGFFFFLTNLKHHLDPLTHSTLQKLQFEHKRSFLALFV